MKTDKDLFREALADVRPEHTEFAELSLAIIDRVHALRKSKGLTQKQLAGKLGKQESEMSRWLAGLHNLTLRNLARLNVALGAKVIVVPPADAHHTAFIYTAKPNDPYAGLPATTGRYLFTEVDEKQMAA